MFIDKIEIVVQAGKGGNGVNSVYRDKFIRPSKKGKGRPDGGNGGKGGDIIIKVNTHIHTLLDFYYRKNFSAANGLHGEGKGKKGRDGDSRQIDVPPGTVIKDSLINCTLGDLKNNGESIVVAKGGEGGKGNIHSQVPTQGEKGERKSILLELKFIADVGIVGVPNSGKSTLLAQISQAKPKVAPYPFTTKSPILGIVGYDDFSFVVADIPGIIEDAHKGKGLGLEFLRHIERTRILIHLIDMSQEAKQAPVKDYYMINKELKLYSKGLLDKPQIVVANKMDLAHSGENLKVFKETIGVEVIPISAQKKYNLEAVVDAIRSKL